MEPVDAVVVAADDVVTANRDLRQHPSPETEHCLQSCISLLSLWVAVFHGRGPAGRKPDPARACPSGGRPWCGLSLMERT